ncbi:MAG: hypothetical protein Pg6A_17070 [Termitinemataceae bacterium]|jgi:heat shock protein HslJ|nr:MAG: hypothetical protein Pg6A_17070 [Termitinemataceae bacterium]
MIKLFSIILAMVFTQSCASQSIKGIDWYLVQLKTGDSIINIDRDALTEDGMENWFSLRFNENRIYGKAAPNNYNADCFINSDSSIRMGVIASTKMMAFREAAALKEHSYFEHLAKVTNWALSPLGYLELYYTNTNGQRVSLVFNVK